MHGHSSPTPFGAERRTHRVGGYVSLIRGQHRPPIVLTHDPCSVSHTLRRNHRVPSTVTEATTTGPATPATARPLGTGIDISGLTKTFTTRGVRGTKTVTALQDVSLQTSEGAFLSLLGPSGCGKSTVLRILAGLESPSAGTALMNGQSPEDLQRS